MIDRFRSTEFTQHTAVERLERASNSSPFQIYIIRLRLQQIVGSNIFVHVSKGEHEHGKRNI